jgi:hypothetical protein
VILLFPAQIYLDDLFIVLHFIDRSFEKHAPLVEDRDFSGNLSHEGHIVLDDDDAMPASQR